MADRPDVVILMTDEERATPPYESRRRAGVAAADARWPPLVRRARRQLRAALHRFAGLRAEPADDLHRAVPGSARRHPDRRHRQALRRFAAALAAPGRGADARQLVPRGRLRHPLRRQVAHLARRPRGSGHRPAARHQRRRRRGRSGRGAALPRRGSARARTASPAGWAPSRTVRPCPTPVFVATRCSPTGSSRGSRTATPGAAPATRPRCDRSCWSPASSTRTTSCCSRRGSDAARWSRRRWTRRTCPPHRPPTRICDQAGRTDRVPRGLLLRLRSGRRDRSELPAERAALPRSLLPAARRGGRADRPGAPRGHRRRIRRTPCWCAPPTTAICSARTAGCTRSGSTSTTRPPACRS